METIEIDVRGLSCPEPVMLTMDAIDEHPGKTIKVIGDEAHTRTNIEKMLTHQKKTFETTSSGNEFTITFQA